MAYRLAVALDSTSFSAREWVAQVRAADEAGFDFVTLEDQFGGARPDAVLVAARVAPVTRRIGLVPVATTTHTEPFHLSTALATLDFVSGGRAGWQARVSADGAALVGRRSALPVEELFAEAADAVEVVRRLWDSWEDDAVIKEVATGRFIDREKLHYIDFSGPFFTVRGPSIVPRPPQGQPVIAALAHRDVAYEFAARSADVVFVTPRDAASVTSIVAAVRAASSVTGRPLKIFADLVVAGAAARDALTFDGSAASLADLFSEWHALGVDGFRLRTGDVAALPAPPGPPAAGTLRERLGLGVAVNRYAGEARVG